MDKMGDKEGLTRRDFLRGIVGTAAGAAAASVVPKLPFDEFDARTAEAVEVGPKVTITSPKEGEILSLLKTETKWIAPPVTTQMHIQMVPFNNDGPGVNLYWGDKAKINEGVLVVPEPQVTQTSLGGQFITLPGMSYKWRIRISESPVKLDVEKDDGWGPWEERGFRTPGRDSLGISPVGPVPGGAVVSETPQLHWNNTNTDVFYYEVQVSKDPKFETDPAKAKAPVAWELIHVGTQPPPYTYYQVKPQYPLEKGLTYYWRVRPRIQGDGKPVEWSQTWSFNTPPPEVPPDPKLEALLANSELTDWVEKTWNGKQYRVETRYAGSPYKVTIAPEQKQALIDVVAKDGETHGFKDAKLFLLASQDQAPDEVGFRPTFNRNNSLIGFFGSHKVNNLLAIYFIPETNLTLEDPDFSSNLNRIVTRAVLENTITGGNIDPFSSPLAGKQEHGNLITGQALRVGYQEINK